MAKLNVKLLRKVKEHILEEPRRLAMSVGIVMGKKKQRTDVGGSWGEPATRALPDCGTVGCIAGLACVLSDREWVKANAIHTSRDGTEAVGWMEIKTRAAELLGIPYEKANAVFNVDHWPLRLAVKYTSAKSPKTRAKIAAERIEHFISTKGAE